VIAHLDDSRIVLSRYFYLKDYVLVVVFHSHGINRTFELRAILNRFTEHIKLFKLGKLIGGLTRTATEK